MPLTNRLGAEFVGTFWLVFGGCGSAVIAAGFQSPDVVAIETDVVARVDQAVETAKDSPPPGEDVLMTEVWADGGSAWRN